MTKVVIQRDMLFPDLDFTIQVTLDDKTHLSKRVQVSYSGERPDPLLLGSLIDMQLAMRIAEIVDDAVYRAHSPPPRG